MKIIKKISFGLLVFLTLSFTLTTCTIHPMDTAQNKKKISRSRSKKNLRQKTHQPIGRYSNSRKDFKQISLAQAERIVGTQLEKKIKNNDARVIVHKKIMRKIKQKAKQRRYVFLLDINEIIKKELNTFENLQKKLKTWNQIKRSMTVAIIQNSEP